MNCVYYSKKSHTLFCHYHFFNTITHVRIYVCIYFSISVFHERFFFLLVDKTISSGMVRVRVYFPS